MKLKKMFYKEIDRDLLRALLRLDKMMIPMFTKSWRNM
jgi:hypothetical protein